MARFVVLMGSGETTVGMLPVHRAVLAGLPREARFVHVDSPFAFEENADELADRYARYFAESVGAAVRRVHLPAAADPLVRERAAQAVRSAHWVFAGPGSPSYALRCWAGTGMGRALAEVVAPGRDGALVLASAAAATLGDWALPVYEIYKVGADPHWLPGLGLTSSLLGWNCAVVPHFDNREGGTHDTRYCYIGGRRLGTIEHDLDGGFILGIDEHTALVVDLESGTADVRGRGAVTVRVRGVERRIESGDGMAIESVAALARELGAASAAAGPGGPGAATSHDSVGPRPDPTGPPSYPTEHPDPTGPPPNPTEHRDLTKPPPNPTEHPNPTQHPHPPQSPGSAQRSDPTQLADLDRAGSTATSPSLDDLVRVVLAALPSDAHEGRRALIGLADAAAHRAVQGSRRIAGPAIAAVVAERTRARDAGDWANADRLRDVLTGLGIELRDGADGSTWRWS